MLNIIFRYRLKRTPLAVTVITAVFVGMAVSAQGAVLAPPLQLETVASARNQVIQIRASQSAHRKKVMAKARRLIREMKAHIRKMQRETRNLKRENARLRRYNPYRR